MKAIMRFNNTDEISATLSFTFTVAEWKKLKADLGRNYPGWQIESAISDLVRQVEKTLTPEESS